MDELRELLRQICTQDLNQIILSNTRDESKASKVKIRPVYIKEQLLFQETIYRGTQVFHDNFSAEEITERIIKNMEELFKQGEMKSAGLEATVLVSKKGKMTIKSKKKQIAKEDKAASQKEAALSHNREKQYILKDGQPVDFLVGLGVQTPDGRVTKNRFDKFKQINRYLEFIEDVLEELPKDRTIRIIDFGCGKSYLTFAMYYYLHEMQKRDIQVTGLDLKTDVILHCNQLAEKLGYDKLHFERGDISTYEGADAVDMVVTLHACDVATDYAMEKAVKWGAKVIMAVPCCQHELNKQMKCKELKPALKYGLIKERMAALLTDAIRAQLLEEQGYDTQILEFIDMEHTPKNLLIRAVKTNKMKSGKKAESVEELISFLGVEPTLQKLLKEE